MSINKTECLAGVIVERLGLRPRRMLVAGCGEGEEAVRLSDFLACEVVGIDPRIAGSPRTVGRVRLMAGDATALEFPDGTFDFVYSFHVLEHIPNYRAALGELRRVLQPGGGWCIGTPNRQRLVGYLGSSNTSWREKFAWNAADWRLRLKGRFRNEFGAHAGFTREELASALEVAFGEAQEVSQFYYRRLYAKHERLIDRLFASGLARYAFPSIYFLGHCH